MTTLSPLEFLTHVWPPQEDAEKHIYCIAMPTTVPGGKWFDHETFETIEAAATFCESVRKTRNVFFNVNTLKEHTIWNPKKKKNKDTGEWEGGKVVRVQKNMRAAKDLFFDLDVGDDPAKYATQTDAIADIKRFCVVAKLPRPTLVSSGGGVHVHWVLTRTVPTHEWFQMAVHLRQLATIHGVRFDPARTTDASSVLRVVGTDNLKLDLRRPVTSGPLAPPIDPDTFHSILTGGIAAKGATPTPRSLLGPAPDFPDDFGSNLENTVREHDYPAPTIGQVLATCGQMRRLVAQKGVMSEPEWYHGLGVIKCTSNPDEYAHAFSKGSPDYSFEETQAKLEQVRAKTTGMTKCSTLRHASGPANDHICASCPFLIQTEGSLAKAIYNNRPAPAPKEEAVKDSASGKTVQVIIPPPPKPYRRIERADGTVGGVEKPVEDKTGKVTYIKILSTDLYPIDRAAGTIHRKEEQMWRYHPQQPPGTFFDFKMDARVLGDTRALNDVLRDNSVEILNFKELAYYMSAYVLDLMKRIPTTRSVAHMGWNADRDAIYLPSGIIGLDGNVSPISLGKTASEAPALIQSAGDLQTQIELMKFFNKPEYIRNQFMILAALGSPLLWATGQHGLLVAAYSLISGASKSTTLYTAASLFGHPERYSMTALKKGGTTMYVDDRQFLYCTLPFMFDELNLLTEEEIHTIAIGVSQGDRKKRLKTDGTPRHDPFEGVTRYSMLLTTANKSLYNILAQRAGGGVAAAMRVLEMEFPRNQIHSQAEAKHHLWEMDHTYGHIGPEYLKIIAKTKNNWVRELHEEVRQFDLDAHTDQDQRCWVAGTAATLVAGRIAYDAGLLPYKPKLLREFMIEEQWPIMLDRVGEGASMFEPLTVLTDYMQEVNGKILVIHRFQQPLNGEHTKPSGELAGHYDVKAGSCWMNRGAFRQWCERKGHGVVAQDILNSLFKSGVITNKSLHFTIGKGLRDYDKGQSRCFRVNMLHPQLAGVQQQFNVIQGPGAVAVP